MKKIRLSVCLHLGSKEHFPWKHENIDFYTILRSVGVDTHPLTSYGYFRGHRYTSGVKKTFFMKTWKYRVLHESEVGWDEYSYCGVTGNFRGQKNIFYENMEISRFTRIQGRWRWVLILWHQRNNPRHLRRFLNIKWKCYFCHIFRAEWWSTLFIVTFVLIHDKFPTQNSLWWFNFINELSVS